MELHLCGSRKYNNHEEIYWQSVKDFIVKKNIVQVLFIGIAAETHPGLLGLQYFKDNIKLPGSVRILNAENEDDLITAANPTVYILGGMKQMELISFIHANSKIENLIRTCPYYFGESMGAKLVGSKLRVGETGSPLVSGLGILKDTIIEGHYTQKNRQQTLRDEIKLGKLKYGLGVDEDAEVVTTPETFPQYQKLGPGLVELITNELEAD